MKLRSHLSAPPQFCAQLVEPVDHEIDDDVERNDWIAGGAREPDRAWLDAPARINLAAASPTDDTQPAFSPRLCGGRVPRRVYADCPQQVIWYA